MLRSLFSLLCKIDTRHLKSIIFFNFDNQVTTAINVAIIFNEIENIRINPNNPIDDDCKAADARRATSPRTEGGAAHARRYETAAITINARDAATERGWPQDPERQQSIIIRNTEKATKPQAQRSKKTIQSNPSLPGGSGPGSSPSRAKAATRHSLRSCIA